MCITAVGTKVRGAAGECCTKGCVGYCRGVELGIAHSSCWRELLCYADRTVGSVGLGYAF